MLIQWSRSSIKLHNSIYCKPNSTPAKSHKGKCILGYNAPADIYEPCVNHSALPIADRDPLRAELDIH